jgi:hypothetical protein
LADEKKLQGIDANQDKQRVDELRGEKFLKMDMSRLDEQVNEALAQIPIEDLSSKEAIDINEGFKKEVNRVRAQMDALSQTIKNVSYQKEFDSYRAQLAERMKTVDQYVEPNRRLVEKIEKNKQSAVKSAITRTYNNTQGVITHVEEWEKRTLKGAMITNLKNRLQLQILWTTEEREARAEVEKQKKKGHDAVAKAALNKDTKRVVKNETGGFGPTDSSMTEDNHSADDEDSEKYNEVSSGDEVVNIDWNKAFHHKQRKTTAWDIIATGKYKVSTFHDANAPKKDKKTLDSVQMFDGKDITLYKSWKESVSMAICANMNLSFIEKLFRLKSKLKGVPYGYAETYQLSGVNLPRALKTLDKLYEENSMDQNALFEKLNLCKPVDLCNYDSLSAEC